MAGFDTPHYRAYKEDVKKGRVILPAWDLNQPIALLPGELYCRIEFCGHATRPSSSTNNLRKHVQQLHKDVIMKDGKAGKTPNEDIMAANRFYSSLYLNGIDDGTSSESSVKSTSPPPRPGTAAATTKNPAPRARKGPTGTGRVRSPSAENHALPMVNGQINAAAVRKVGIRESGRRAPCVSCRRAKKTCGSTAVCEFWAFFDVDGEEGNVDDDEGDDNDDN